MPDRYLHNYLCKMVLGKDYDRVNAFLDAPVRVLGPNHRILFHDNQTIGLMSMVDMNSGMAAMLHKILDENKPLQDMLKIMAIVEGLGKR